MSPLSMVNDLAYGISFDSQILAGSRDYQKRCDAVHKYYRNEMITLPASMTSEGAVRNLSRRNASISGSRSPACLSPIDTGGERED